jgi:cyclophilin family peptidyl-prolyl cis-trans isomerase
MYKVFLDIGLKKNKKPESWGKIVIQLYSETPKTSENFKQLCTGEKGFGFKG